MLSGAIHHMKVKKLQFADNLCGLLVERQLTGEEQTPLHVGNNVYWREVPVIGNTTAATTVNCQKGGGKNRQLAAVQFGNGTK